MDKREVLPKLLEGWFLWRQVRWEPRVIELPNSRCFAETGCEFLGFSPPGKQDSFALPPVWGQELPALLRRIDSLQELRDLFHTNASEGLALEVSFLRAFGN